jgi:type I restriction enzyme S subunit
MKRYEKVKLGAVAIIRGGKRLPAGMAFTTAETAHPYVRARDIGRGKVEIQDAVFLDQTTAQRLRRYTVNEGDLCLTIVGANVGEIGVVPAHLSGANLTENAVKIVTNGKANQGFLKYALLTDDALKQMKLLAGGAAQPKLGIYKVETIEFPFPPLPVQARIAGILSAYDDLIENSQRRIRVLEEMARSLYREWFVHFRFPGHENHRRVPSPLGDIPEGWEVKPLESLMVDHIGGGWGKDVADEDHTEPAWVIRGTDIPDARSSRVTDVPYRFHTVSNLRTRRLQPGDILFEVSGGSKGQPVGRALLVTSQLLSALGDESAICASFCKRVRPDAADYGSELLYLSFVEGYESGEIEQFQVQSTGISNFKWTEYIGKTERVIPPPPLRVSFRGRVAPLFSQIATLGLQIQNLRRTRDLLLPRLMSGEVNVGEN